MSKFNTRFILPCTRSPQAQAEGANWEALNGYNRGVKGSRVNTPCHSPGAQQDSQSWQSACYKDAC